MENKGAAGWWSRAFADRNLSVTRAVDSIQQRNSVARLLNNRAQELVREDPESARIFTVKPDRNNRRAIAAIRSNAKPGPSTALVWAESALLLDPENLICWVTCAHVRILLHDLNSARAILEAGIQHHRDHVRVNLLWQNLGVVEGLRGEYKAALDAYRRAVEAGALLDRKAALAAVCIVATKLRIESDLSDASAALCRTFGKQGQTFLVESIRGRRNRGTAEYWSFTADDVAYLRVAAPGLAATEDWCIL